jgi:phosphoglycerate kinase
VENDKTDLALQLIKEAESVGVSLVLPSDHLTGDADKKNPLLTGANIPPDRMGLDIGDKTIARFCEEIRRAKMVLWNGPVGLFEVEPYNRGSNAIAQTLGANTGIVSIVAGGDTVAAVGVAGIEDKITHLSTGGGATLEYLEGKILPGIKALEESA